MTDPAPELLQRAKRFLTSTGLATSDEAGTWVPLTGGVSSDLWRVDLPDRTVCVKGALSRLRVADPWFASTDRNAVEYRWLQFAGRHHPANVPALLAHDADVGVFVMEFLPPDHHPVWKSELLQGRVDTAFAGGVGGLLGSLHAESTRDPVLPAQFATDVNFTALRLDPFLRVTGRRNPEVADRLEALAVRTGSTHRALVHGDISPKNILVGPEGPVILDAECAWYGDPAFDVAFCLTQLSLKMLAVPGSRDELLASASALTSAHAAAVDWEDRAELGMRVATLLPALLLARVDGASPVEYLTDDQRVVVRREALRLLGEGAEDPDEVLAGWHRGVLLR